MTDVLIRTIINFDLVLDMFLDWSSILVGSVLLPGPGDAGLQEENQRDNDVHGHGY